MSRNSEKSDSLLHRYYNEKNKNLIKNSNNISNFEFNKKLSNLKSIKSINECELIRTKLIKEIKLNLNKINDPLINESVIRDLNDTINKLFKKKNLLEIYLHKSLNGTNYLINNNQKKYQYKYYGRAKDLPDVKKLNEFKKINDLNLNNLNKNNNLIIKKFNALNNVSSCVNRINSSWSNNIENSRIPNEFEIMNDINKTINVFKINEINKSKDSRFKITTNTTNNKIKKLNKINEKLLLNNFKNLEKSQSSSSSSPINIESIDSLPTKQQIELLIVNKKKQYLLSKFK
ncbi:unnamed protein product [[Candida] boidinii]|uniref:Pre-mRNA-splicing factor ISY1 n=1 Tax=Candida boidinii TaxID=5477 RepID=A0A9W6W9W6_CANBO|nr:hypothetical protein B5S33_g3493 [[Candida] boidinii]GME70593.1 unnamed protein product [[Candida] boidinii]